VLAFSLFGLAILVFPSVRVVFANVLRPVRHRYASRPFAFQVSLAGMAASVFVLLE
jgi:hypothetical protein